MADVCAGWATGSSIMVEIANTSRPPIPTGPVAPDLDLATDPLVWHAVEALSPHAMRRRRRVDAWRDDTSRDDTSRDGTWHDDDDGPQRERIVVEAFFRDSHVDGGGLETVLHEYSVSAAIDATTMRFTDCEATVGALPWQECPQALGSARRLVGAPVTGLRAWVRDTFVGTTTCTHLNDTLRALEDVGDLVRELPRPG
jgi:hypothetical protein